MVIRPSEAQKLLREVGTARDWEIPMVKLAREFVDGCSLLPVGCGDLHFAQTSTQGVWLSHGDAALALCPTTSGIDGDYSAALQREREAPGQSMNVVAKFFVRNRLAICTQPLQVVLKIDDGNWIASSDRGKATIGVHASAIWVLPVPHLQEAFF
jgi:hypothetical protein